ncbi:MAG: MFS transporter [Thermoproteota archaeon]|nr:MFS transporter [Thermoproteota archaeon]
MYDHEYFVVKDYEHTNIVQTLKRSTFSVLFTTVFLDFLGFALILPYIFFYAEGFGASPLVYGLLLSSYSIAQFVFTPVWGSLSDRFGRRKIILLCLIGSGISFVIFGMATNLTVVFISRIAAGAMAATFPVAMAYIADITTPETRFKHMARIGAAFGLGMIVGPAIGGTLSSLYGYTVPSLVAAMIAFSNFAIAYFKLPESLLEKQRNTKKETFLSTFKSVADKSDIKLILAAFFIAMVAFFVMDGTATPWTERVFGFGPFQAGLLFFYIGSVIVIVQGLLIPKLSKSYSPQLLLVVGIIAIASGLAMLGSITTEILSALIISSMMIPLGMGFTIASVNMLVSLRSSVDQQGSAFGVTYSVSGIAQIAGPAFGASMFGYGISVGIDGLPFIVSAALTIPAIILTMNLKGRFVR